MAGLARRSNQYQRIPSPEGSTGAEQASVYQGFYGEMPMPATDYATSTSALKSSDPVPSVTPKWTNAAIVHRANRRNGMKQTAGFDERPLVTPQIMEPVFSSKAQDQQIGPIFNYFINMCLYRAGFPAATAPGRKDPYLSTKVDQLVTRSTGGPGTAAMTPAPRFGAVQKVPRFSTMPKQYPTQSAKG